MATVTGAKPGLCLKKNSKSTICLQGTDFLVNQTDVVVKYPSTGTATHEWGGKIKNANNSKKAGEVELTQSKEVKVKEKLDGPAEVSITVGTTEIKVEVQLYDE